MTSLTKMLAALATYSIIDGGKMNNKEMVSELIKNNKIKYISFSRTANGFSNFWYDDGNGKPCSIRLSREDSIDVLGGYCLSINYTF